VLQRLPGVAYFGPAPCCCPTPLRFLCGTDFVQDHRVAQTTTACLFEDVFQCAGSAPACNQTIAASVPLFHSSRLPAIFSVSGGGGGVWSGALAVGALCWGGLFFVGGGPQLQVFQNHPFKAPRWE